MMKTVIILIRWIHWDMVETLPWWKCWERPSSFARTPRWCPRESSRPSSSWGSRFANPSTEKMGTENKKFDQTYKSIELFTILKFCNLFTIFKLRTTTEQMPALVLIRLN
jgi:hypothetical protein